MDRTCPQCGAAFVVDSRYLDRKFCSAACGYANRTARNRVEVVCPCGATFVTKRHEVARGGGKFCSRACWRAHHPRTGATPENAARMQVERLREGNPTWRGDAIGIAAAHDRVRAVRGRAGTHACVDCGGPARDWALRHDSQDRRHAPNGRAYSILIEDYQPMCRGCHIRYDRAAA